MNERFPLVVANLKANKTWDQISIWLDEVRPVAENFVGTVIFCPSHPFLALSAQKLKSTNSKIKLGAQDISQFEEGAYTGEVAATQIKDLVSYSIIGHSERRKHFSEQDVDVVKKADALLRNNITPILCVSDIVQLNSYAQSDTILNNAARIIFVYEPPSAISGGGEFKPDNPNNADENASKIATKFNSDTVIYGGSINPENARGFFSKSNIKGGLVGQASIDPQKFIAILKTLG